MTQSSHTPSSDPYITISLAILQEHLRQARQLFNVSLVAISLFLCVSTVGAVLILWGKTSEGTVTTATGLVSTTLIFHIARESSQKLEDLRRSLKELRHSPRI